MAGYGYENPYNTAYGAQGAADAGGFMQGEVTSSPAGGKSDYGKDTVRPLTIKQILDAEEPYPEAGHQVDKVPISNITFIGQIRNISTQATNITYKIDDGTGVIEVKHWNDTETGMANQGGGHISDSKPEVVEDGYCRVWGKLKAFNNKKHVWAHVIRPVTDYNEIHYHLLDATAVHLFFTRGPPDTAKGQNGTRANGNAADVQQTTSNGQALPSMSPGARKLLQTLKASPESNEGLHIHNLVSQTGMNSNEVQRAAEELISYGLIFTTVDEFTWALLEY